MHKYFAEWYRVVELEPKSELLENRWKAIEKIGKSINLITALDLVRVFRAKPTSKSGFSDEYRSAFQKTDSTFSMRGNELEMQVLAGANLAWCLDNCKHRLADAVAFALLCVDCKGLCSATPVPEIVQLAEAQLYRRSSELRAEVVPAPIKLNDFKVDFSLQPLEEPGQGGNLQNLWPHLKAALEKLCISAEKSVDLASAIQDLAKQLRLQQEESNILWWLFGGFSRDLNSRMSDLDLRAACLVAGKELADLVLEFPGPFSAVAFLDRVLRGVEPNLGESITIQEAVNLTDSKWRENLLNDRDISIVKDLCPIHLAIEKSLEVDEGEDWLPSFRKSSGFEATDKITPLDLSMQIYQECLFVRATAEV